MTARKTHFDFHAEGLEAVCGATPRGNAPALELSERRKDVDCAKCLKFIDDYDEEHDVVTNELIEKLNDSVVNLNAPAPFDSVQQDIANRNGLTFLQVANAFRAGYLKR